MKGKIIYEERYKYPYKIINKCAFPILKHATLDAKIIHCEIRKAGILEVKSKRHEYQDLRIYFEDE